MYKLNTLLQPFQQVYAFEYIGLLALVYWSIVILQSPYAKENVRLKVAPNLRI